MSFKLSMQRLALSSRPFTHSLARTMSSSVPSSWPPSRAHLDGILDRFMGDVDWRSSTSDIPISWIKKWFGAGSPAEKERFDAVRSLPSFLLPRYFAIIVQTAYMAAWRRGIELLGDDIQRGLQFTQHLFRGQAAGHTGIWPKLHIDPVTEPCNL